MKYIVLSGGRGERFLGSLPKPLNRVCGKAIGEWMTQRLILNGITNVIWALNPILYQYNVEQEITRWTGCHITNTFVKLPFETRDACETLEILLNTLDINEPFICLDNDNIYIDGLQTFESLDQQDYQAAILVKAMTTVLEPRYGFVKVEDDMIIDGKEKIMGWGENAYSIGGYYFNNVDQCKQWLQSHRSCNPTIKGETSLLSLMIKYAKRVKAVYSNKSFSIGTPQDCNQAEIQCSDYFGWHQTRIVVDLDNTLVTNPVIAGDYSTSEVQVPIVEWIRDKSQKGAEIIVSTARKMKSSQNNVNRLTSKYGADIIADIKSLNLDEDEINLGKPLGDIYIDDRAINPYDKKWKVLAGDWAPIADYGPMNALPTTRKVGLKVAAVEHVFKTGSIAELAGQAHYFKFLLASDKQLNKLFPKCYDITVDKDEICIEMEHIRGVPASYLWCNGVWGEKEWLQISEALNTIHTYHGPECCITWNDVISGYVDKVMDRCQKNEIYGLVDPDFILRDALFSTLESYYSHWNPITCIHGDAFMGNIIFSMKGEIKMIDMRGEVNGKVTILGDPNYDWGKLATSFLGMDSIVYNLPQRTIEEGLLWIRRMPNPAVICVIALLLMYGAMGFYTLEIAEKICQRIKDVLISS